ncbi:MAG: anaerobic ribonucleoside-triphosphate reductase [Candidatus Lokiarchaeota archaeon]|nr:anaerobic ribonucleoside-triphosphate reductase [Candidatus Lokiarchaeota archaeon]
MSEEKNDDELNAKLDNAEYISKLLPEVFVSTGDVRKFNPVNIMDSMVKEAGLPRKEAKKVTELVVRRIIASGIKFLSGPHIRELVCSALSELNFEDERKKFTRIGMPIHDYEELLESKYNERAAEYTAPENIHRWASGQLASEFTLLKLLKNDQARCHLSGDIHIHSLRYFDMRPFAQSWDLRLILEHGLPPMSFLNFTVAKPAKKATTAIMHACKWLGFAHSEFAGEQSYLFFNTFIAPYLKGLDYEEIKQLAQVFIFETNQQYISRGSHIPITSIVTTPKIPTILTDIDAIGPKGHIVGKYGDFQDECNLFFNALSEVYAKGDARGKFFAFPKHKVILNSSMAQDNDFNSLIFEESAKMGTPIFINSDVSWMNADNYLGNFFNNKYKEAYLNEIDSKDLMNWKKHYINIGALQSVSINLPRIVYEASSDLDKIKEHLNKKMECIRDILLIKQKVIQRLLEKKRLLLCSGEIDGEPILNLKRQALVFGYVGLNEMAKASTGYELHEDQTAVKFGREILNYMLDLCKEYSSNQKSFFTLWEQPAEFATYRFAALDHTHYKKKSESILNGNKHSGGVYYTPASHVNYKADISLDRRIQIHKDFADRLQNNCSMPIWLNEDENNNIASNFRHTTVKLLNSGLSKFCYNFDFSLCFKCNTFQKGIVNSCKNCGNNDYLKNLSKITDYYTTLELWNAGKRQEFEDRKKLSL